MEWGNLSRVLRRSCRCHPPPTTFHFPLLLKPYPTLSLTHSHFHSQLLSLLFQLQPTTHGYAITTTTFFPFSPLFFFNSSHFFLLSVSFSNELHGSGKVKIGINGTSSSSFLLPSLPSDQFNTFSVSFSPSFYSFFFNFIYFKCNRIWKNWPFGGQGGSSERRCGTRCC